MTYLTKDHFSVFHLTEKTSIGEDLQRLRFCTPEDNEKPLGIFPCEYISIKHGTEENYERSYSVVSQVTENKSYLEIVLKVMLCPEPLNSEKAKNVSSRQDKTSKRVSQMVDYLLTRKPTDEVLIRIGGGFAYEANKYKHFGFIVGGSGISPAMQVITEKLKMNNDKTSMYVLFGAPLLSQLLFRKEFEEFREENDGVDVHFTLDRAPTKDHLTEAGLEEWKEFVGFADAEKVMKSMPPPGDETKILCCGPFGMMKFLKGFLPKLGYTERMTYFYM